VESKLTQYPAIERDRDPRMGAGFAASWGGITAMAAIR